LRVALGLLIALASVGSGCGGGEFSTEPPATSPLVGVWTAAQVVDGEEKTYRMTFEADGTLIVVGSLVDGGQRSYPGTWSVEDDMLTLTGKFFASDGEVTVWFLLDDDSLTLGDKDGSETVWSRLSHLTVSRIG